MVGNLDCQQPTFQASLLLLLLTVEATKLNETALLRASVLIPTKTTCGLRGSDSTTRTPLPRVPDMYGHMSPVQMRQLTVRDKFSRSLSSANLYRSRQSDDIGADDTVEFRDIGKFNTCGFVAVGKLATAEPAPHHNLQHLGTLSSITLLLSKLLFLQLLAYCFYCCVQTYRL